jgi:UDP-N-acetylglucosamine--N-acetylmuramyl-(pentapeptide) pyrophosphoryl-undecaprenol N-acetylglucosamine transferase
LRSSTYAIIAGGGTGGHVVPAVAVGRALVELGHAPSSIRFVGSARGVERRMVPAAGFALTTLPGRGLVRRWDARTAVGNAKAVAGLAAALGMAVVLVGRLRPAVVVSAGGWASLACAAAAALWRIPVVVMEQNAVPGAANRLAGKWGTACAVSFPGTDLPRAVVTGNPVRPEVVAVDRSPRGRARARQELGLPATGTVVAVAGGSLGARQVNQAAVGLAERWWDCDGVAMRHVIGERDWPLFAAQVPTGGRLTYQAVPFEDHMERLYAAADVFVGRAGASTVAELAAVGLGSVLVPLPGAPGDHQTANARRLEAEGAAVVVADADCDAPGLAATLEPLLGDAARRDAMDAAARRLGRPDAARAVARLVEQHARG